MALPAVTVIIPTFNRSEVLRYAIASVMRQTFADFELLVIGDACTDDSEQIVAEFSDARVHWINLPTNVGHQSGPNNEGLRQARAEVIAYLGHDDLWLPHHLATLVPALANGAVLAHAVTISVGADGVATEPAPARLAYRPGVWIPPTGVLHRRAAALEGGGWKHFREVNVDPEIDLWRRLHERNPSFVAVRRLTAVKFPAARRRAVYATRPCDEQQRWWQRIESEPDFELTESAKLLFGILDRGLPTQGESYPRLVQDLLNETKSRIVRKISREATVAKRREFKGLD